MNELLIFELSVLLFTESHVLKVDGSENERLYMPDGLIYFRLNLEELLVDICQLMGPTSFVTKVLIVCMLLLTLCFVVSLFLIEKNILM